jgi:hypothetical protein
VFWDEINVKNVFIPRLIEEALTQALESRGARCRVNDKRQKLVGCFNQAVKECNNSRFRVARWFIITPKTPIWAYFGGPWYGK